MKYLISIVLLTVTMNSYSQTKITSEDLKSAIGSWEGTITYLDYSSNKPFTMLANLIVEQGKNESKLVLNNIYPKEPKANNTQKIKMGKDGLKLNKHRVTSKEKLKNGSVQIQTENEGKDDNMKALIRYTYIIGNSEFVIRKEVQFNSDGNWIKRSEYKYNKPKKG